MAFEMFSNCIHPRNVNMQNNQHYQQQGSYYQNQNTGFVQHGQQPMQQQFQQSPLNSPYQQSPAVSQYQSAPTSQYQSGPQSMYQSGFQSMPNSQYQQPPPASSPYSAYPEYNEQSNVKTNFSYQNQSLKGWNEPPSQKSNLDSKQILTGIKNPETTIVLTLTTAMNAIKPRIEPSKLKMLEDSEKRVENLFEKLAQPNGINEQSLAYCWVICDSIGKKQYAEAKTRVTEMMTVCVEGTRWILGLKRIIEMLMTYQ